MKPIKMILVAAVAVGLWAGCGENPANEKNVTKFNPDTDYIYFTDDRDGKTYKSVIMGEQVWMAENLNYDNGEGKCYGEGGEAVLETNPVNGVPTKTKILSHEEQQANCERYGRLYGWVVAMDIDTAYNHINWKSTGAKHRGICPNGWHLPTELEWNRLYWFVGNNEYDTTASRKLKSKSGWADAREGVSGNGTDSFGFSALPGGGGDNKYFKEAGERGFWWGADEWDNLSASSAYMAYYSGYPSTGHFYKTTLLSVRCVQD